MTYIKAAFEKACTAAVPAEAVFVSLYVDNPFYGGPEEGGWWGSDTELVAYQRVSTKEEAAALKAEVIALSDKLSQDAKDEFNRRCAQETEWLEARGLEDDFLPEVDGEQRYWVAVETKAGEHVSEGDRFYS